MLKAFGRLYRNLWLLLGLLLTGCATFSPELPIPAIALPENLPEIHRQHLQKLAGIQQFKLKGRIGVQANGKGFSGSAQWRHARVANQTSNDDIALFSPLGSQFATIKISADEVRLVAADSKIYTARDVESLTREVLGWSLPVTGLMDWVLGRPAPGIAELIRWDAMGRITRLTQSGWEIEYLQYIEVDGFQLPNKINLRNQELGLKLVIKEWDLSLQANAMTPANKNQSGQ